ncbi:uncharacterized protein LY79DRAFT_343712 [Colletotrichum navitas]|uniref:Uncharacterized protein n=1 Tax=Colletotrichum navitas TaxID=681940 RepID=A0AAD8PT06_9PEZI|nr:uncharacterized protein LY79DRAFT_343712 [Colletotrichum navitas]KAK1579497.1 hypothetical protein LY79DRAFT_343712 [Colletotrichum navitas]
MPKMWGPRVDEMFQAPPHGLWHLSEAPQPFPRAAPDGRAEPAPRQIRRRLATCRVRVSRPRQRATGKEGAEASGASRETETMTGGRTFVDAKSAPHPHPLPFTPRPTARPRDWEQEAKAQRAARGLACERPLSAPRTRGLESWVVRCNGVVEDHPSRDANRARQQVYVTRVPGHPSSRPPDSGRHTLVASTRMNTTTTRRPHRPTAATAADAKEPGRPRANSCFLPCRPEP